MVALWTVGLLGHRERGWSRAAAPLVITDVNVVPLNQNTVLRRQTVLIERGRIKAIGAASQVKRPAGAVRLDGRGKYLLPGLIDMHAHLPGQEGTAHPLGTYSRLQLAAGVVGLRSMRGDFSHLHWHDSLRRTAALAPACISVLPCSTATCAILPAKATPCWRATKPAVTTLPST